MTANILEGGAGDLEVKGGKVSFAFNDREDPWHRLGQPVRAEDTTPDIMMARAMADFEVILTQVIATDANGQPLYNGFDDEGRPNYVYVDNSRATVRVAKDGTADGLATVGTRYSVTQNREVLDAALAIVGASQGDARIDTVGVLDEGRRFFATIDLGGLVLELPDGVTDPIARFLGVETSHDGKIPMRFHNGNTRQVCKNTVQMAWRGARSRFTARHTKNGMGFLVEDAQRVLQISTQWADGFKVQAEKLARIPASMVTLDRVIEDLWPVAEADTERKVSNRDDLVSSVRGLWQNERNAGTFGQNAWTVTQAVTEYLDHYRAGTPSERALTSMNPDSWVSKAKLRVQELVTAN